MSKRFRSTSALADELARNPDLVRRIQNDPESALRAITAPAYSNDKVFYRLVVIGLLAVVIIALLFAGLAENGTEPSQVVTAMGTTALGAVAGLLAPRGDPPE
ncbi:MAG: hypothetical protein AAFX79_03635 [Planctomycetota bacterium]